jgi:hypothetical protein
MQIISYLIGCVILAIMIPLFIIPISDFIDIKLRLNNKLKEYPIIKSTKLIKLKSRLLEFTIVIDTNLLIAEKLIGNEFEQDMKNDIKKYIEDKFYDCYWIVNPKYIEE